MKLLSLSTAEQGGSLAIVDDDRLVCEEFWDAKQTHSKRLLSMIEHMVENRSGMALNDMDAFVAARGPGSFTGLRIGIGVIKGLAYALGKPALGVSSLDGIGFRFAHSSLPVCVMMDARRNEVYTATYWFENGTLVSKSDEQVIDPDCIVENIQAPVLFVGSGSKAYQERIEKQSDTARISDAYQDSVSAVAMIQSLGLVMDLDLSAHILEPVYLRKSDAELNIASNTH